MNSTAAQASTAPRLIEVKLGAIEQLFNSMDPSPFHERDLDHDAEQFIVSWAQEFPSHSALRLVVHLERAPEAVADPQALIAESVKHYFHYRAEMTRREFRLLMKEGRVALAIGLAFLMVCELAAQSLPATHGTWSGMVRQGLTIIGWVAMWRPLEIYLYRWWPVRRLERVYRNLSQMQVEVRQKS
jgi:HAMP domain-containing protein